MLSLNNHLHVQISTPPPNNYHEEWFTNKSKLINTTHKATQKIATKYIKKCIQKAISKYHLLYDKSLKRVNKKVFKNIETPSLLDRNNNIISNLEDIGIKIHIQQSLNNRATVPIYHYQLGQLEQCTSSLRQYPWHDLDGFIIEK